MKVPVKGYVVWRNEESFPEPRFETWPSDMSGIGPTHIGVVPLELEVEIPDDFDPIPEQVAILRKKKQEVMAQAQQRVNNLEEQIQRLLCIEYKPEEHK